jgi:hypothetical protein
MKTRTILSALSLGLMLIAMTAVYSTPIETPNPISQARPDITYVVNIAHYAGAISAHTCTYFILITTEQGHAVAPPQEFRPGVWSYIIKEKGNVTGTRVAKMVSGPALSCPGTVTYRPDSKTGIFKAGQTFQFLVAPVDGRPSTN